MGVVAQMLEWVAALVSLLLTGLYCLILIRALISWINPDVQQPAIKLLYQITDPVLEPFRKILMPVTLQLGIDLSPVLAFFVIVLVQRALGGLLLVIAHRLP